MEIKRLVMMAGLATLVAGTLFSVLTAKRQEAERAEAQRQVGRIPSASGPTRISPTSPAQVEVSPVQAASETQERPTVTTAAPRVQPSEVRPEAVPPPAANTQPPGSQKAPTLDPLAREALSYVGADPGSTAYWATAINNPFLPDEERKNLIEDLNEDGLSDPEHPAPEDMPLIANRIALILELAPFAIDQVNADAFAEAFKDLVALLDGQPVR